MMRRSELLDRLLAVFFPKTCGFCDAVVEYEDYWCGRCPLPRNSGLRELPGDLGEKIPAVVSPFFYEGAMRRAILRLKRQADHRLAGFLAGEMAAALNRLGAGFSADCIVAVPQSLEKQARGSHDHAALLADRLAARTGIPVRKGLLLRSEQSQGQHALSRAGRLRNARASYHSCEGAALNGERVVLVDDVLTTGATAWACADCLLGLGAGSVCVLTSTTTKYNV